MQRLQRLLLDRLDAHGDDLGAARRFEQRGGIGRIGLVALDVGAHVALRLRAAANDRSISELVNEAVRVSLAEDAADLSAFDRRKKERTESFDSFVQGMKRRGLL